MEQLTINSNEGISRCTKCGGIISGNLQYVGDNYCNGHEVGQSNASRIDVLVEFCRSVAKQKDCPPEFIEMVNKEFWNLI